MNLAHRKDLQRAMKEAITLGYVDATAGRKPRTGREIIQAIRVRLKVGNMKWRIGHQGYIKYAYSAGRFNVDLQASDACTMCRNVTTKKVNE